MTKSTVVARKPNLLVYKIETLEVDSSHKVPQNDLQEAHTESEMRPPSADTASGSFMEAVGRRQSRCSHKRGK